jgi:hypothetical protein
LSLINSSILRIGFFQSRVVFIFFSLNQRLAQ